jgi:hypothetical protein
MAGFGKESGPGKGVGLVSNPGGALAVALAGTAVLARAAGAASHPEAPIAAAPQARGYGVGDLIADIDGWVEANGVISSLDDLKSLLREPRTGRMEHNIWGDWTRRLLALVVDHAGILLVQHALKWPHFLDLVHWGLHEMGTALPAGKTLILYAAYVTDPVTGRQTPAWMTARSLSEMGSGSYTFISDAPPNTKGSTGFGARTLVRHLENLAVWQLWYSIGRQ